MQCSVQKSETNAEKKDHARKWVLLIAGNTASTWKHKAPKSSIQNGSNAGLIRGMLDLNLQSVNSDMSACKLQLVKLGHTILIQSVITCSPSLVEPVWMPSFGLMWKTGTGKGLVQCQASRQILVPSLFHTDVFWWSLRSHTCLCTPKRFA